MTPQLLDCLTQAVNLRFKGATFAQDLLLDEGVPQELIDIFNNVFEKEYKMEDSARGSYYFKLVNSKHRKQDEIPAVIGMFDTWDFKEFIPEPGWQQIEDMYGDYWILHVFANEKYSYLSGYGETYYDSPEKAYIDLISKWYENGIYPEDNIIKERESNDANEDGY